jgi:DNA-binding transcriptional LysR family regulator
MIDPRRLRVLAAVAGGGSISAAAETLHLTPPAVSQQLLALEREVGVTVLDRSGRRVTLTAAGRLLAGYAEKLGVLLRQAEGDLAELTGRVTGPVRLAAFQSVMRFLVGPALRDLTGAHPGIDVTVVERYGPPAVIDLRRGDLDVVLTEYDTRPPVEPALELHELAFDPYRLVVPREWRVGGLGDLGGAALGRRSTGHRVRPRPAQARGGAAGRGRLRGVPVRAGAGGCRPGRGDRPGQHGHRRGHRLRCAGPRWRHIAALCRTDPSPAVRTVLTAVRRSPSGTSARPTTRPGS